MSSHALSFLIIGSHYVLEYPQDLFQHVWEVKVAPGENTVLPHRVWRSSSPSFSRLSATRMGLGSSAVNVTEQEPYIPENEEVDYGAYKSKHWTTQKHIMMTCCIPCRTRSKLLPLSQKLPPKMAAIKASWMLLRSSWMGQLKHL